MFSFINSSDYFFSLYEDEVYDISENEKNTLFIGINKYYGAGSNAGKNHMAKIKEYMTKDWGGACNGMAFTVLHDALGKIDFNRNAGEYDDCISTMYWPSDLTSIRSGIHFYQLSVCIQAEFRSDYSINLAY